jgi:hypothetical protein
MAESVEPYVYGVYENREKYVDNKYVDGSPIKYTSFAGTDIVAQILVPFEDKALTLGELQTLSYSIHRENKPIRCLGHTNVRGFVRGPRTIAGSMIFTVFNSYAFYRLEQFKQLIHSSGKAYEFPIYPLADMLPPFDILITYANEYGQFARMKIFGVTIVDEGGTMSIEDLVTEQTYTFIARGIQPITSYEPALKDFSSRPVERGNSISILPTTL